MATERTEEGEQVQPSPRMSKQEIAGRIFDWFAVLGLTGLAGYGGANLIGKGAELWLNFPSHPLERPENPVFPRDQEGNRLKFIDHNLLGFLKQSLETYGSWGSFGQNDLQRLLEEQQPKETTELLHQIGQNFIREGVAIVNTAWLLGYTEDQVFINSGRDSLWVNDDRYDLKEGYDSQLASAWMQTKSMWLGKKLQLALTKEGDLVGEMEIDKDKLKEELEILVWLKQRQMPIELTDESFAFFPRQEMISLARTIRAIDKLDLNIPQKIEWCVRCLSGIPGKEVVVREDGTLRVERKGHAGGIPTPSEGVKLENTNLTSGSFHEIAHLASSKNNYLESFTEIRGHKGTAPHINERLKYVSLYAMADKGEDFAETVTFYVMGGRRFRDQLDELEVKSPPDWQVLKNKYLFFKDQVFGGIEFAQDGQVRDADLERREAEFAGIMRNRNDGSVTVRPNPAAWGEKRYLFRSFQVLVDGEFRELALYFSYNDKERLYEVSISDPDLVSQITLFPISPDERVSFNNYNWEGELAGAPSSLTLVGKIAKRLLLASLSAVEVGQNRQVHDNSFDNWRRIVLRGDPNKLSDSDLRTYSGVKVEIVDGPVEAYYQYSGQVEKFWQVTDQYGNRGWISERWLGKEVKP